MSGAAPLAKFIAFTVACVVMAGVLVVQLGNIALFEDRVTYEAVMDNASGLLVNDPVKIAGVDVGKVHSIELDRGQAIVTFSVRSDRVLGQDTTLGVRWRNVFGLRFLYLYPDGAERVEAGHRFAAESVRQPTDLTAFLSRLSPIMQALDPQVGNVVVQALAESLSGREDNMRGLVADAGSLLQALGDRSEETGRLIANGARVVDAYAQREQELRDLIDRFADVSVTVAERNDALIEAVSRIADGQGELRRLVQDNDAEIRGAISALDAISAVLAVNHEEIEQIFTHTGPAIVSYHRISRWGQWFNIRVPGLSSGEQTIITERGAELPPREDPEDGPSQSRPSSSPAAFFTPPGGGR